VPVADLRRRFEGTAEDQGIRRLLPRSLSVFMRTRPSNYCRPKDDGLVACSKDSRNGAQRDSLWRLARPSPAEQGADHVYRRPRSHGT
jgi:hypothetical protein